MISNLFSLWKALLLHINNIPRKAWTPFDWFLRVYSAFNPNMTMIILSNAIYSIHVMSTRIRSSLSDYLMDPAINCINTLTLIHSSTLIDCYCNLRVYSYTLVVIELDYLNNLFFTLVTLFLGIIYNREHYFLRIHTPVVIFLRET